MINRVILIGRLTKDPDLRYTPNGNAVATFTLAVNRPFTNQEGEREADFIQVVVWRRQAENTANFLRKGSLVGVDGRLQTRSYEKDGRRVYVTEVVADSVQFLEPKGARDNAAMMNDNFMQPPEPPIGKTNQDYGNPFDDEPFADDGRGDPLAASSDPIDISDDDLPF